MHVRFFCGNQQELRIGLRFERLEVRVELVEAEVSEIGRMPVAVEVHDHRRIDAHGLQHRLERRRPLGPVGHGLHGVGEMPMRAQRLVSGERGESIAIGVAKHVRQRRLGCAVGYEEEDAHALRASWGRVDPRVVLPVLVPQLPHADAHAAAPRAMPQVREVRREVARKEVLVWSGKHGDAAAGGFRRQRPVADFDRLALGLEARAVAPSSACPRCRSTRSRTACCCRVCDRPAPPCRGRRRSSTRRPDRWSSARLPAG